MLSGSIAILLTAVPAQSSPRVVTGPWLPASTLSGPGAQSPLVAVDARGNATVVWSKGVGNRSVVKAAFRPAGGRFEPARTVTAPAVFQGPSLGVDASGNGTLVWAAASSGRKIVVNAVTLVKGKPVARVRRIGGPDTLVFSPVVAVNAHGDAVAAWLSNDEPPSSSSSLTWVLRAATRRAGGSFGPAHDILSFPPTFEHPRIDLSIDASGDALLAWAASDAHQGILHSVVQAAYRPAGGTFGPTSTLADATNAPSALVERVDGALDARGDAVVAWWDTGTIRATVRAAATGDWQSSRGLGNAGVFGTGPAVAVDADGNAIVAWVPCCSETPPVQVSSLPAGTRDWLPPQNVSQPGTRPFNLTPAIAIGAGGEAVAAWSLIADAPTIVAARRPAGGAFAPSEDVWRGRGWASVTPAVAIDPEGDAVVAWRSARSPLPRDEPFEIVRAAGYDAAGPKLGSLRVPSSAKAGATVRFSVSPVDAWSAVASTSWSFGDGTAASGRRVSHRYGAPGAYSVTATSSDVVGNSSHATRTVLVR